MARCSEDVKRTGWSGKSPCHNPAEYAIRWREDTEFPVHACRYHVHTLLRRMLTSPKRQNIQVIVRRLDD